MVRFIKLRSDAASGWGHEWVNEDHIVSIQYDASREVFELSLTDGRKLLVEDQDGTSTLAGQLPWS